MKQITLFIIGGLALVVIAGIMLMGGNKSDDHQMPLDTTNQDTSERATPNNVDIRDFAFTPAKIVIKKGTTITWTNQDSARHDIAPDNPSEDFKASKLLAKGESYSFTFNKAGTYSYFCSPHPYMKATIEVTE